jgi:hypothetical protein
MTADHIPFPGVEIDYGEDGAVYIKDEHGEIVMWTYDEIREDPDAWTASLHAVGLAARGDFSKIRSLVGKEIRESPLLTFTREVTEEDNA